MLDFDLKRPEPLLLVIRHQLVELSLLLAKGYFVLDKALLSCLHSLIDFLFLELLQHEPRGETFVNIFKVLRNIFIEVAFEFLFCRCLADGRH